MRNTVIFPFIKIFLSFEECSNSPLLCILMSPLVPMCFSLIHVMHHHKADLLMTSLSESDTLA